MQGTVQLVIATLVSLIIGGILGFFFGRWWFLRQLKEIEKNYQKSVRQTYQDMGSFFGRKLKGEDLNKITTQLKEGTEKPKKPKPKRKK